MRNRHFLSLVINLYFNVYLVKSGINFKDKFEKKKEKSKLKVIIIFNIFLCVKCQS